MKRRLPISAARVKALALRYGLLTEAAAAVDLPLVELIEQYEELSAAWEKGQLLRRLYKIALSAYAESQAPKLLRIDQVTFKKLLTENREAAQLWTEGRLQRSIEVKNHIIEAIRKGTIPVCHIVNLMNRLFEAEPKASLPDIAHVPPQALAAMARVSRQTVHEWSRKGLPRNADGTYDMRVAVPWLRRWERAKVERERKHSKESLLPAS